MRSIIRSALALCSSLAHFTPAQAAPQDLRLEIAGLGSGVATAGDLDGDGAKDLLVGGLTHAFSVPSGKLLFESQLGVNDEHAFGALVRSAGDQDGDGIEELVFGETSYSGRDLVAPPPIRYPLRPRAYYVTAHTASLNGAGASARLGDIDGDGVDELALGWPDGYIIRCGGDQVTISTGGSGGLVSVHSGFDGALLYEHDGRTPGGGFGGVLARIGDVDGDGLDDLAVACRYREGGYNYLCNVPAGNYVRALSAGSGALLWEVPGSPRALAPVGDLDGDGQADVALGISGQDRLELRSGTSGALLRVLDDAQLGAGIRQFGCVLRPLPDMDADGQPELLVGAPEPVQHFGATSGPGRVVVLSPRSGKFLQVLRGDRHFGQEFGAQLAVLGDTDGDGRTEIAVGSARVLGGLVQVYSLRAPLARR